MYITDVSIRRPIVAWVFSLILVVFGIFVFSKLPVRELPAGLQPPVVQIKVDYKSASAVIVDEEVTQVIEEVIEDNPKMVQDYLGGKDKLLGFFVGQAMKKTKGKANPKMLNDILINKLNKKN